MAQPKIAVVYYSMYGHVKTLSDGIVKGLKEGNPQAQIDVFLVPETLPDEVLTKMHAGPKADLPTITPDKLKEYDAIAMGIPTRYGRAPAQWSAFFDQTGGLWASGALRGKMATIFTSTASQSGGQETTALTTVPFLAHQGLIFVPFGYGEFAIQTNLEEPTGGSAYGAGGIAGGDGSRAISDKETTLAVSHGKYFAETVTRYVKGSAKVAAEKGDAPAVVSTEGTAAREAPSAEEKTEPYKTEGEDKENTPAAAAATTATDAPKKEEAARQETAKTAEPAKAAKNKEQKKSGGLFGMCCGGSSQKNNFS